MYSAFIIWGVLMHTTNPHLIFHCSVHISKDHTMSWITFPHLASTLPRKFNVAIGWHLLSFFERQQSRWMKGMLTDVMLIDSRRLIDWCLSDRLLASQRSLKKRRCPLQIFEIQRCRLRTSTAGRGSQSYQPLPPGPSLRQRVWQLV